MAHARVTKQNRSFARAILIALLFVLIIQMNSGCRQTQGNSNGNSSNANAETFDAPPFQTKEPDRYQATIATRSSSSGANSNVNSNQPAATEQRTFVARDGERRRTEFEVRPGVKIVMLDLPSGHFVLMPSRKSYADLSESTGAAGGAAQLPQEFSPEVLNNESRGRARYERLGVEDVNGRAATKYRVTTVNAAGATEGAETIIWIDESLGMPIKSETSSRGGAAKFSTEMTDIRQDVDASLFELPSDYKKESVRDFYAHLAD